LPDHPELLLRLTHTLAALPARDPLPLRMCLAFVNIVDARSGAITLGFASSERTLLSATDSISARYEDVQDIVREGPSLDAYRTREIVASASEEDQRGRWPGLASALTEVPATVHAIPISPDSTMLGVLTVHGAAGVVLRASAEELQFLSDAVGAAIIGEMPAYDGESRLWTERDRVSQATGMVVAQLGIAPADALAVLRAHAFAHESTVVAVSRLVVNRMLDFARTDPRSDT
jgi:hypothetical protein